MASVSSIGLPVSSVFIETLNLTSPALTDLTTTRQVALVLGGNVFNGANLIRLPTDVPTVAPEDET